MASIWVTESGSYGPVTHGRQVAMVDLNGTTQKVAIGASSAQTGNAFGTGVVCVTIQTDAACHVKMGTNPTAANTDPRLPADMVITVPAKVGDKLAVIQV